MPAIAMLPAFGTRLSARTAARLHAALLYALLSVPGGLLPAGTVFAPARSVPEPSLSKRPHSPVNGLHDRNCDELRVSKKRALPVKANASIGAAERPRSTSVLSIFAFALCWLKASVVFQRPAS